MNPIRHCAFAVVLSLAVNRLPAQHPPAPAPAPGDRVRVTSADRRATGTLVGLGAGAIVGGGCNGDELCGIQYVFTIPAGALVGLIVGSVIGGEHWDRADVPATVTFRPEGSGRVAVGVSLRF